MSSRERMARANALGVLRSQMRAGQLTIVEGATPLVLGDGSPQATIQVRSPGFWPMLLRGSRGMAEAYMDGYGIPPT